MDTVILSIDFDTLLRAIDRLTPEQKQVIQLHLEKPLPLETLHEPAMVEQKPTRIPNLHAGMIWVSDDFDDPLPDEFWLGGDP